MTRMEEELVEIKETLVQIGADLKYHIKRTNLMEERFQPVEDHVKFVRGLLKLLTWMFGAGALAVAIIKLIKG